MNDHDASQRHEKSQSDRVYLFLQGPASPLFGLIGKHLSETGAAVLRINFNLGDQLFWRNKGASNYRGTLAQWPSYIQKYLECHQVTDLILIGEERDYHRIAIDAARQLGAKIFVVDMGYLRPDWITLERDGISSNSRFPADPEHILAAAASLEEPDWSQHYHQSFAAEAAYDLLYNLPNVFFWFLFPHYKRHAIYHPLAEYAGWFYRFVTRGKRERKVIEVFAHLEHQRPRYFIYPLQLQTDFQLRVHSPYVDQRQAILDVLQSFATDAPSNVELVIKSHPLDPGLVNWQNFIQKTAEGLHISSRVHVIEGGDLSKLLAKTSGVVTVNSTAALHGMDKGVATKTLGEAIYNIAGLTDQRPLAQFWSDPQAPNASLVKAFYRLMAHSIQLRGNLSSSLGASVAAKEAARRIRTLSVNQPHAFSQQVPRQRPCKIPTLARW